MEIGEYIRTKKGIIAKVDAIYEYGKRKKYKRYFTKKNEEFNEGTLIKEHLIYDTRQKYIPKHSKNILDLIEVGDIVNGYQILEIADSIYESSKRILIYKNEKEKYERWIYIQQYNGKIHTQDDIQLILTHEQFERDCYRLEDN